MTQQVINIGAAPNDGTGDPNRTAWDKSNDNFTELYAGAGSSGGLWNYNKTDVDTTTAPVSGRFKTNSGNYRDATQIAIHGTTIQGISRANTLRTLLVGDIIQCQDSTNSAAWCRYVVQSLPIDNTTWFQFNVTLETDGGVASGDNQEIIFAFTANGSSAGGGSGIAAEYSFNGTVAAPPASGQIRLNNATQSSATIVWINNVTVTGVDIKHILGATQVGAKLIIQDKDDSSKYAVFQVASTLVDHTTYWEFPVTFISGGSALAEQRALFAIQAGASGGGGNVSNVGTPTNGQLAQWTDATHIQGIDATSLTTNAVLRGYIDGLTLAWISNTSFSVAAGQAVDSTNTTLINVAASITKTTAAWAVGSGNGGLDTGAIAANTWYHVFLIRRSDTSVVDVLFSLNVSSPTMPANYNQRRRVGSIRTDGSSQFLAFSQNGDNFVWQTIVSDQVNGTWTSAAKDLALTVPTGVVVEAIGTIAGFASAGNAYFIVYAKTMVDTFPVGGTPTIGMCIAQVSNFTGVGQFRVLTNTSAQIRLRSSDASGTGTVNTIGWVDARGRNS